MQPKVYSRDGKEVGEFPKGDMYIRDLKNTKGGLHVYQVMMVLRQLRWREHCTAHDHVQDM